MIMKCGEGKQREKVEKEEILDFFSFRRKWSESIC